MLGTIDAAGTFSFDFVKTLTCAEGGVVMTNNADLYTKTDGYSDHGHDHKGVDRGADLHPFIGYNYRISELHAAVGLAQIRKLHKFLSIQKRNHAKLKEMLSIVPGITFRRTPDPDGDSCTFISWFLPGEEEAKAVVAELKSRNILAGNFYWYDNNWHYIRKWDHLKQSLTLNSLDPQLRKSVMHHANKQFPESDAIMCRCISTLINLSWTEQQLKKKGEALVAAIMKVLARQTV